MADDELPVPRKEDVLFASNQAAWRMDAIIDFRPGHDYAYREGYRRTGRILTEYAAERGEVDFLVYPICHAYRHYVELSLKRLMLVACRLLDREMTDKERKIQTGSHNLQILWETFKLINKEVDDETGIEPAPPEQMEGIESYIGQIHAIDEGSFSFRYALTKSGAVNLEGVDRINLAQFSECMEALCNYLDGWDSYFAEYVQLANERRDDYARDMYSDMGDPMYGKSGY